MGPSAIRYAGLEERLTEIGLDRLRPRQRRRTRAGGARAARRSARATCPRFSTPARRSQRSSRSRCARAHARSCSAAITAIAMGTLAGLAAAAGQPGGVIWIDAHGDLNTPETSPSGNVHGMPLAAALGRSSDWFAHDRLTLPALDPSRVALVGIRSLDPAERAFLREADIRVFTMSDIDRIGIEHAMREALDRVAGPGLRARLARPGLARPGGRAGRRHAGSRRASPTARRTSPAS